jgi:hypothetical protein
MATSAKAEFLQGAHCFNATVTPTATAASASTSVTSVSSMTGVCVGMGVTGTGITAGSVVAATTSSTALTLSKVKTAIITGGTLTIAGDIFKMSLIKVTPSGTYDSTLTNAGVPGTGAPTTANIGTDEVASGGGYTTGGLALTNVTPVTSSAVGYTTFSPDPSWTSATFSCVAAVIYNTSARLGGVANRVISIHDLGGTQSVSAGTLTLVCPAATSTTALIRLS